jgi:hypothetical protein
LKESERRNRTMMLVDLASRQRGFSSQGRAEPERDGGK